MACSACPVLGPDRPQQHVVVLQRHGRLFLPRSCRFHPSAPSANLDNAVTTSRTVRIPATSGSVNSARLTFVSSHTDMRKITLFSDVRPYTSARSRSGSMSAGSVPESSTRARPSRTTASMSIPISSPSGNSVAIKIAAGFPNGVTDPGRNYLDCLTRDVLFIHQSEFKAFLALDASSGSQQCQRMGLPLRLPPD